MDIGTLLLGVLYGATYGLLGLGLVLVYKSNRFLNLAHGQLGALSAQVLATLVLDVGLPYWVALLCSFPLGIAVAVAVDRLVVRPLRERNAPAITKVLVTVGVTQVLIAASFVSLFTPDPQKLVAQGYPQPFTANVRVAGVVFDGAAILTAVTVPFLVIALALFLSRTMTGKCIRAAASNADAARLCGISARRVSLITWGIAGGLSSLTAIVQAPAQGGGLNGSAALGPTLLLLALGAAAFGAFTSLSLALAGGILLGVVQQVVLALTSSAGDALLAVFGVAVCIVLVRGRAIGEVFSIAASRTEESPPLRIPAVLRERFVIQHRVGIVAGITAACALLAPHVPGLTSESNRFQLTLVVVYALAAVSLTVALGWAGQVSLGHFALIGVGAFVGGRMLENGWSLFFTLVPAGLVAAFVIVLVGLPALRVPGLTLALTTLGLALVAPEWLFRQGWFGSEENYGLIVATPMLARGLGRPDGQIFVYYAGCTVLLGVGLGLLALRRTQAGRIVLAVRDNPDAAASFGLTPATVKVAALALSGFIAGAAGVLWADAWRNVSASQFPAELSYALLALPVIGGVGSIGGAVAAAVLFYGATAFVAPHLDFLFGSLGSNIGFQLAVSGLALVITVLTQPLGLAGAVGRRLQARLDRMAEIAVAAESADDGPALIAEDITVRFGGLTALDAATVVVEPGEIVGLIGPNGAGKSTMLNVIGGRLRTDGGRVALSAHDLTALSPELRAAFGLARSFQDARLFPGLTVREVVQVAMGYQHRSGLVASAAGAPWVRAAERRAQQSADELLDRFGLTSYRDTLTADLSTGTRRICDLVAQVASKPKVLLLDEPTAGVAQREAEAFGPLLRSIRDDLDCSILLVEHDMPLLMGLCDRIYLMVAGRVVTSGTPDEMRDDPRVIASYLGTDEAAVSRSGSRIPAQPKLDQSPRPRSRPRGARASAAVPVDALSPVATRTRRGTGTQDESA